MKGCLAALRCSFALNAELATVPGTVLEALAACGTPLPDDSFVYNATDSQGQPLKPIEFKELDLQCSVGRGSTFAMN